MRGMPRSTPLLPTAALALAALSLAACDSDDPQDNDLASSTTLEIRWEGTVDGAPLAIESEAYPAPGNVESFRLTRGSFYVSDVRLVEVAEGRELETEIADVLYFLMEPRGVAATAVPDVPVGEYSAVRFRLGLNAEQDATTPADYASTHPLGRESEYWADWGSYIFLKMEGRTDTLADGVDRHTASFTYHVGKSAELAREIELALPIQVGPGAAGLALGIDFGRLLGLGTSEPLPFVGVADHRNGLAPQIMNRAAASITPLR